MHGGTPRFSVCQFTLATTTFEDDIELLSSLGVEGIGICEAKLRRGEEQAQLELFNLSNLEASICIPDNIGPLSCDPAFPGPSALDDRIEAMCASIHRLAPFRPDAIVVITGSGRGRSVDAARGAAVDGLRAAADTAGELGLRLSIEPLRMDVGLDVTIVRAVADTLELIAEIDRPNVDIAYDVYHLWDTPGIVELTRSEATRFSGVHICDWHEPPRTAGDRLLPGDGTLDLVTLVRALEEGGFTGWYDLEIFSDHELVDSLWRQPPAELVTRGRDGFMGVWAAATA